MESVDDLKAKGNAAFSAGQFDAAVESFTDAIALDPGNAVLYSNRSAAYASLSQWGKALADGQKAAELRPTWSKAYSRIGAAAHGLRRWDEAIEAYTKGLELEPSNQQLTQGLAAARAAAAPPPSRPAASAYASSASGGRKDLRHAALAAAQALMVALAVVSVLPFVRPLSWKAFFLFCRVALVAQGYKLYLTVGLPSLRPFPAAFQPWLQRVATSGDLFYLLLASLMLQNQLLWLGVVPLAINAAYGALDFAALALAGKPVWTRAGAPLHAKLLARRQDALRLSAVVEVALGFQSLLSLLQVGMRGLMSSFVLWQQLRLRRWTPDSRALHQAVWAAIGSRVAPLLAAVPAAEPLVAKVQTWWNEPGRQMGVL